MRASIFALVAALALGAGAAIADSYSPPSFTPSPIYPVSIVPGNWYAIGNGGGIYSGTYQAGTALGTSTTGCNLFSFPVAVTIDKVEMQVAVAEASGGAHFAIYAAGVDSSTKTGYPTGAPLAEDNSSSPGFSIASAAVSGTATLTTPANAPTATSVSFKAGTYYDCVQTDLGTGTFEVQTYSAYVSSQVQGSPTDTYALPVNSNQKGSIYYSSGTYGTWPNTSSLTGWTLQVAGHQYGPAFIYHVVSSP